MNALHGFLKKLAKTCPSLQYMALGLWLAWTRLAFGGAAWVSVSVDTTNELTILPFYTYSGIAFTAVLLLFACNPKRIKEWTAKPSFSLAGGLITSFAALGIILLGPCLLGPVVPHAFLLCCVTYAMTGAGTAFFAVKCGEMYGKLQPRAVILQTAISVLVMVSVYFIVLGAPEWSIAGEGPTVFGAMAFVLLPLAVALLAMLPCFAGDKAAKPIEYEEDIKAIPFAFWKMVLVATVLVAASSAVSSYLAAVSSVGEVMTDSSVGMMFWIVVAVVFACAAVGLGADKFHFGSVYSGSMAFAALVIAVIPLSEFFSFDWGYFAALASCVFDFAFRCILAFIVFQKRLSPVVVFGFGLGGHMLGGATGWVIGYKVLPVLVEIHGMAPFFVLALVGLMAVFVLFSEKDFDRLLEQTEGEGEKALSDLMKKSVSIGPGNPAIEQHSPRGKFKIAVDLVADEYSLSRREKEVLRYLAMGYESNAIAEKMGVSWNTVRTHTRNLYGKLDVHSKQDAVALVDAMVAEVTAG